MAVNDGRVISNLIVQSLRKENLTIYGDGSQTRSFCYVDDLISGIISLLLHKNGVTEPINLGNPKEFTMLELASLVIEVSNSSSRLSYLPLPSDDPKQRCPDINKAETLLDWKPTINLHEGISRTIDYFKNVI